MMKKDLESTKKAFENWRRNKKSPKERIPKDLLNEAIKLGKKYGYSKTAKELGLNSKILLKSY